MIDSALLTALASQEATVFQAVRIQLPEYDLKLYSGSGSISFTYGSLLTFQGYDATFGSLTTLGAVATSVATEAPTFTIALAVPTTTSLGEINQPGHQGSKVDCWFGAVDSSGFSIGQPYRYATGRLDTVKSTLAASVRTVEITCISPFERFFKGSEGIRLNPNWYRRFFPDSTGLNFIAEAGAEQTWGAPGATITAKPFDSTAGMPGGLVSGTGSKG